MFRVGIFIFVFASMISINSHSSEVRGEANGEVVRIHVQSKQAKTFSSHLVGIVTKLGGKKAKRAKLGGKMRGGYYFNILLPRSNYERLWTELNKELVVQAGTYPHKKITPKDLVRVVVWVEKKKG